MYCKNCGKEIPDNATICPECKQPTKTINRTALVGLACCGFYILMLILMIVTENTVFSIFFLIALIGEMVCLHKLKYDAGKTGSFVLFGLFLSPILTIMAVLNLLVALDGKSIEGEFLKKNQSDNSK